MIRLARNVSPKVQLVRDVGSIAPGDTCDSAHVTGKNGNLIDGFAWADETEDFVPPPPATVRQEIEMREKAEAARCKGCE